MTQMIYLDLGREGCYELEIELNEIAKLLELQSSSTVEPRGVRFKSNLTLRITNPTSGEQIVARSPRIHLHRPAFD